VTPLEAALEYAARGWHVLPIPQGQKYPRFNEWQNLATTDEELITIWWDRWPDDGVGIACGAASGIFVVDIDVVGGKVGDRTLADLEAKYGELPETYTVLTPTGGKHYYFRHDPARPLGNGTLGLHVDTRGDGGQVVAPPTIHPDTGTPYLVLLDVELADLPEWAYDILLANEAADAAKVSAKPLKPTDGDGEDGPAQRFNEAHTWEELLTADGWTLHHVDKRGEHHWTRPGKDKRDGSSATTNYDGRDCLKVFSPNAGLEEGRAYSKFGYYAATKHNDDRSAAATQLLKDGYAPDLTSWITSSGRTVDPETGEISDEWPVVIPLGEDRGDLPAFPLHVLPEWMANQCIDVADKIQVPVDLPATIGLAVLSLACTGRVNIEYDDWVSATNLYLVIAMPPGAGKSPVFKAMTKCVERHELALAEHMVSVVNEANSRQRSIKARLRKAEEKGDAAEAAMVIAELNTLDVPAMPRLIVDDVTVEALVRILHEQKGRLALMSTEGGLFEQMTGRYNADSRANLDPYLQAWSGDTIRVDRIGRDTLIVGEPLLTIGLTVQPQVLSALAERPELAGRGLTSRFMYSMPPDIVGKRDYTRRGRKHDKVVRETYEHNVTQLLQQMASYRTPGLLSLCDEGGDAYAEWRQSLEDRRVPGGPLRPLAEWTTKLEATVLRLVGLLHVAHGRPHHGVVEADMVSLALEVADYWVEHAFAVHDLWGTDEAVADARTVADWIKRQGVTTFTARDVYSSHRRRFPKSQLVEAPLQMLTERGWIRPVEPVDIRTGRRGRSLTFEVNPALAAADELRAMRALAVVGEKGPNEEKPANKPKPSDEVRAMRAMCLDTNLGTSTSLSGPDEAGGANEGGRAHGAHGAQLPEPEPVDNSETYNPYPDPPSNRSFVDELF
jgi:replicative DNA helicase